MCDCIEDLQQKIKDHCTKNKTYKKPIKRVKIEDKILILGDKLQLKTVSNFEIELEGQKKKPLMPVTHSYCPFCGEKIDT